MTKYYCSCGCVFEDKMMTVSDGVLVNDECPRKKPLDWLKGIEHKVYSRIPLTDDENAEYEQKRKLTIIGDWKHEAKQNRQ